MCFGYFYLLNSSVVERRAVNPKAEVRPLFQWRTPTRYHLLFKTYKQAAMHWVTSESSLLMRRSRVRVPPQVPTRVAQLVERQYSHPRNSRLLFKETNTTDGYVLTYFYC